MEKNKIKIFRIIRIIIYILLLISILLLKYTDLINLKCYLNENFGILCPTCGITRAIRAISNCDFELAIERNAYCTLVLFPIFLILLVDDVICIILNKKSFVEIIFGE